MSVVTVAIICPANGPNVSPFDSSSGPSSFSASSFSSLHSSIFWIMKQAPYIGSSHIGPSDVALLKAVKKLFEISTF